MARITIFKLFLYHKEISKTIELETGDYYRLLKI